MSLNHGARRVLRGARRVGGRDEPPDRADHGDGELPDVRQPVVQPGHHRGEVRRAVRDPHRQSRLRRRGTAGVPARPRSRVADQPGDPGPVQHGLDVQGVRRLGSPAHRIDRRQRVHHRQRHVQGDRIDDDVCAQGIKCVWRNSFCSASTGRAATDRSTCSCRSPCPATCTTTASARSSSTTPGTEPRAAAERGAQLRLRRRDRASTCPTSSTAACPTTRPRRTSSSAVCWPRARSRVCSSAT